MKYNTILFERESSGVAVITINRPDSYNTFTEEMALEFRDAWNVIRSDDDIRAVVLNASQSSPAFSAGVDVKYSWPQPENVWKASDPGAFLGPKSNRVWKPVVCAVHGMACGGALYWINESDIVICSPEAEFFDPHVTYGLTAAVEPIGLSHKIALHEVLRMALLGNDERIGAETALRISLVTEIVSKDNLNSRAMELARSIAAKPAASMQGTVRAIWESLDTGREAGLQRALAYTQLGNSRGKAELERSGGPTPTPFTTR